MAGHFFFVTSTLKSLRNDSGLAHLSLAPYGHLDDDDDKSHSMRVQSIMPF